MHTTPTKGTTTGNDRDICEVLVEECENSDSSGGDVARLRVTIVLTVDRAGMVKATGEKPETGRGTLVAETYAAEKGVNTVWDDVKADNAAEADAHTASDTSKAHAKTEAIELTKARWRRTCARHSESTRSTRGWRRWADV